jgi:hypothetical protein
MVIEQYSSEVTFAANHGWMGHGGPEPETQIMDWYHFEHRGMCQNTVPPDYWMAIPARPR